MADTRNDLGAQQARDIVNLPVCTCCRVKIHAGEEYERVKGWGQDEFLCDNCLNGCKITFTPEDYISSIQCLQAKPEPMPSNQGRFKL